MPSARVKAFAKINLSLEVLNRRPDGFHNLRTIFQSISLADTISITAERSRRTSLRLESDVDIPGDNLILRAADIVLERLRTRAQVEFKLAKRIPLGGGLGGGSTDAAVVLLALPALLGRPLPLETLVELSARLGSDVPFFLLGGTALGMGRGTELYSLPDAPPLPALLIAPGVHVSTPAAYAALGRTPDWSQANRTERTARAIAVGASPAGWSCSNDFETVVLPQHRPIASALRQLRRAGAQVALMSGSGSSVFGLFESAEARDLAAGRFPADQAHRVSFVNRAAYGSHWRRMLRLNFRSASSRSEGA